MSLSAIRGRFSDYRNSAKDRGHAFDLTLRDFQDLWQEPCSYCGSEIATIGLDRIDSSRGYEPDNVTPCCTTCNRMKMAHSAEEFFNQCRKITLFVALRNPEAIPEPAPNEPTAFGRAPGLHAERRRQEKREEELRIAVCKKKAAVEAASKFYGVAPHAIDP